MTDVIYLGGVAAPTDARLLQRLQKATTFRLTPKERHAQRKSWLLGQTHALETQIDAYLEAHP